MASLFHHSCLFVIPSANTHTELFGFYSVSLGKSRKLLTELEVDEAV